MELPTSDSDPGSCPKSSNEDNIMYEKSLEMKADASGPAFQPSSERPTVLDRATWTVDCLEASLNARGVREARLRRSIGQLRPVLIQTIAAYEKPRHFEDDSEAPKNQTGLGKKNSSKDILLGWLEIAIRRLARRLDKTHAIRPILVPQPSSIQNSYGLNSVENSTKGRFLFTEDLEPSERLKRLSDALLCLGLAVGPNSVTGPISDETRTLRGVPNTPSSDATTTVPLLTGWQRWCASVQSASSSSELHLLARALERGLRPAPVKRKKAWNGKSNPMEIRCTACGSPPGPPTAPTGPDNVSHQLTWPTNCSSTALHTSLATCAGCYAPFHFDCLLNNGARSRCFKRHKTFSHNPTISAEMIGSSTQMTGYCSPHNSLSSLTAARREATIGSLYLCNSCCRVIDLGAHPDSDPEQLTGDEDWDQLSITPNNRSTVDEHATPSTKTEDLSVSASIVELQRSKSTHAPVELPANDRRKYHSVRHSLSRGAGALIRVNSRSSQRQHLPAPVAVVRSSSRIFARSSNRSFSSNSPSSDSGGGLPPKRIRPADRPRAVVRAAARPTLNHLSQDANSDESALRDRMLNVTFTCNGHGLEVDDEVVINLPFLKRAAIVLSPCDSSSELGTSASLRSDNPQSVIDRTQTHESTYSNHCRPVPRNIDQRTVEQLFVDLCGSASARPLLRCGLGRTLAADDESHRLTIRHSVRTRGLLGRSRLSKPDERLYAWDLTGLKDLLTHDGFPGGPAQALDQLRLLIKHWMHVNRPGSRLHQCAQDLSRLLEDKLTQVLKTRSEEISHDLPRTHRRSR